VKLAISTAPWFRQGEKSDESESAWSGRWLERAGFMPRQRLKVDVRFVKRIVTHA